MKALELPKGRAGSAKYFLESPAPAPRFYRWQERKALSRETGSTSAVHAFQKENREWPWLFYPVDETQVVGTRGREKETALSKTAWWSHALANVAHRESGSCQCPQSDLTTQLLSLGAGQQVGWRKTKGEEVSSSQGDLEKRGIKSPPRHHIKGFRCNWSTILPKIPVLKLLSQIALSSWMLIEKSPK